MRAMFMVMASVLLAAGLFGCHRTPQEQAAAPAAAAPPEPVSAPPPPPSPAPVEMVRHHRRHYAYRARSSYASYGESSSSSYGESPSSSSSYSSSDESGGYQPQAASIPPPPPPQGDTQSWTDGYGREHYATTIQADENPAALTGDEDRVRSDPWHGYAEQ